MGKNKRKNDQQAPASVKPLLAPLQELVDLLSRFENQGVIIGGIAASLLGSPRYTVDLDAVFLIGVDDIPRLLEQAAKLNIRARISDPLEFARKSRVLLLKHLPSETNIDISLGILPFEYEMVERSQTVKLGNLIVRLPTPEDLIIMKAIAHRSKDLGDIEAIAERHPNLDKERIKFWVEQFGSALEMPQLWESIAQLLE